MSRQARPLEFLGVPIIHMLPCLLFAALLSSLVLLPALLDFGKVLLGAEDMHFFLWLYWHYENSLKAGSNPFFADEIFYPYGISLVSTTVAPFSAVLYLLMPAALGAFGKITILQWVAFFLSSVFSFCLVYHFTRSVLPSLVGSSLFAFSVYVFAKSLNHLNYLLAFPFLALFFLFYFDALDKPKNRRNVALLSLALLLIALNEMTLAVMTCFIVFLDLLLRYAEVNNIQMTPRRVVFLAMSVILGVVLSIFLSYFSFPVIFTYTLPSLPFLYVCFFEILGLQNFLDVEKKFGCFQTLLLSAIPTLLYLAIFFAFSITSGYPFPQDSALISMLAYAIPIEYTVLPSDYQAISHLGIFQGLPAFSESGVYVGLPLFALLFLSAILISSSSPEESRFRNMAFLCLLFSFPVIGIGITILATTPFFVAPLFPLLPALRVAARFMIFFLLFASVTVGLLLKRLLPSNAAGALLACALLVLLLAERWPASDNFLFDGSVPDFYSRLAADPSNATLFIYPDAKYFELSDEVYYQTVHGKRLSIGVVSRFPNGGNPLNDIYASVYNYQQEDPGLIADFARSYRYDYLVVEKREYHDNIGYFYGVSRPLRQAYLENVTSAMESRFGAPIYEDDFRLVYRSASG